MWLKSDSNTKNILVQKVVLVLLILTTISVNCVMFSIGPCVFNAFESCEANDIHYFLYSSDQPKLPYRLDNANIEVRKIKI